MSNPHQAESSGRSAPSGVQSVHRALDLLEIVSALGGTSSVVDLASRAGLPAPTTHRLLRTLVERGYMRQLANRHYALGFRLVPLGTAAHALIGTDAEAVLQDLVADLGESANLAILSGDRAEYVAQVPSRYAMRMFTEIGRHVELHCTGVGKALLSRLDDAAVGRLAQRTGLRAQTPHTLTTLTALLAALEKIREQGYALDEQEQELGVRCVAVAVPGSHPTSVAVSVSGPLSRMTDEVVARAVPLLCAAADRLSVGVDT